VSIRRTLAVAAVATLTTTGIGLSAGTATAAPPADSAVATYIVTLTAGSLPAQAAEQAATRLGGQVEHVYTAALKGYAVRIPTARADRLRTQPGVVAVEQDQPVQVAATQDNATWGLDRIDQASRTLDTKYTYTNTGAGVTAYVIDTGIRSTHNDLRGRVAPGYNAVSGKNTTEDCNGHGTHVAGTIGGTTYGVAKAVRLVPVRVLGCNGSGTTAGVIAGINWLTGIHQAGQPAVANMSLGGGGSTALDTAVANSIADGVTYAVAAGNDGLDASNYSPARVPAALTVGATNNLDARASFSNYGEVVDLFAPGVSITSAWYSSNSATKTISGTSMAAPHVTGVAALYLQLDPTATPEIVTGAVLGTATGEVVTDGLSDPDNDLLHTAW
jgi:subtilisin family serine protease